MGDSQPRDAIRAPALSRRRFVVQGGLGLTGLMVGARAGWAQATPAAKPPAVPVANRAPLVATPFTALPLGSVRARGWLLRQLELQRDGLTGHADQILPAAGPDSAWLGGTGEDWEKGPYYVKGLIPLAYTLDDPGLKAKAQKWVDSILNHQRADGSCGPRTNDDWWPRMVATYLLRDYAEATADPRVIPFLTRYFQYMAGTIGGRPLRDWGKARAGDQIDTIFWLYNRTGDAFLLPLADTLAQQTYPWTNIYTRNRFYLFGDDSQTRHGVNVAQALKMPAVYSQRSQSDADRRAYAIGLGHLLRDHGLACGIASGTESLAGPSTTQGVELCAIVERMLSDETALRILGDATIGDNLEWVAFNALAAATTRPFRQHVYYTLPNNVTAPRGLMGFDQDYDDARTPAPRSGFACCCYNLHMGWPKLAQNSWAATREGGVAVLAYVPSEASVRLPGGAAVTWTEETDYPFGEEIRLKLAASARARFPLVLRIPAWCREPTLSVNGEPARVTATPGSFATIDREWSAGDEVGLRLPMEVEVLPGLNRSVSVRRGPLVYSLPVREDWQVLAPGLLPGFESLAVTGGSPWNYALELDPAHPARSFQVRESAPVVNPFEPAQTPVTLQVRARRLPPWTLAWNGRTPFDPPLSPVAADTPAETLTLAPFGTQMLRVTNFPVLGIPPLPAREFRDTFAAGDCADWVLYGGGWFVRDAAIQPASNGSNISGVKALAMGTQFADFIYDALVSVGPQGDAGLIFRVSSPSLGVDSYNGYYVGLSAERGEVELGKASNHWTSLGLARRIIAAQTPHHVRVDARGSHLRVFVADMNIPLLDLTDDTFQAGWIGVRRYCVKPEQTHSAFSAISVTAV